MVRHVRPTFQSRTITRVVPKLWGLGEKDSFVSLISNVTDILEVEDDDLYRLLIVDCPAGVYVNKSLQLFPTSSTYLVTKISIYPKLKLKNFINLIIFGLACGKLIRRMSKICDH